MAVTNDRESKSDDDKSQGGKIDKLKQRSPPALPI